MLQVRVYIPIYTKPVNSLTSRIRKRSSTREVCRHFSLPSMYVCVSATRKKFAFHFVCATHFSRVSTASSIILPSRAAPVMSSTILLLRRSVELELPAPWRQMFFERKFVHIYIKRDGLLYAEE